MPDEVGKCGHRGPFRNIILEANELLADPQARGDDRKLVRLRLARDELSTKAMKVESAEEAGRLAERELVEALDRLRLEIEVTRRSAQRGSSSRRSG